MEIKGNIVDVVKSRIYKGTLIIEGGVILDIIECENNSEIYILPGFIDSHVHVESSMLTPFEFGKLALRSGTVSVVADPHEIANVLGEKGIDFMIRNSKLSPLKFYFGVPSCVPATNMETSGGVIRVEQVKKYLKDDSFVCLSEMMNVSGVIKHDSEVHQKIQETINTGKKVDGHSPGLIGNDLILYSGAGITTDHECSFYEEAVEKIGLGMKILIREGSAAKDFNTLFPLIDKYPDDVMFCTDDFHPDDLSMGHINSFVVNALKKGCNLFNVLKVACKNPVEHYNLKVGLLQKGDFADFIVVNNLTDFKIVNTYISGKLVYPNIENLSTTNEVLNVFNCNEIEQEELEFSPTKSKINVISVSDGLLYTKKLLFEPIIINNRIVSDVKNDILKLVVLNRYSPNSKPAVAFIKGFGFKTGAVAQTIAHDSHNIIAVGVSDEDILDVINTIISVKGGIVVKNDNDKITLPLQIGGIISNGNGDIIAEKYKEVNNFVKKLGSTLSNPLMTLSFMALLVIPEIKLSDKGLFCFDKFNFIPLSTE